MKKGRNTYSVRLYDRKLPSGKIQLLLQFNMYGKRMQESTGIMIEPNDSKRVEREKREAAETYRRNREAEIKAAACGEEVASTHVDDSFYAYFDKCIESKIGRNTRRPWITTKTHLLEYEPNRDITFRLITKEWVNGFREHLLRANTMVKRHAVFYEKSDSDKFVNLSQNTASTLFQKLRACLNKAYKDGIIKHNPIDGIPGIKILESTREYLTEAELKSLMSAQCPHEITKRAFFFSCFAGFRFSDVIKLDWSNITVDGDRYVLAIKMQKTSGIIYQSISATAASFLGNRKESGIVFEGLGSSERTNRDLRKWKANAGISKHVTFHVARHTFATLLLTKGSDLYTVSKLLGHSNIKTTQIYAKIVDEKKRAAVDSLNSIFG